MAIDKMEAPDPKPAAGPTPEPTPGAKAMPEPQGDAGPQPEPTPGAQPMPSPDATEEKDEEPEAPGAQASAPEPSPDKEKKVTAMEELAQELQKGLTGKGLAGKAWDKLTGGPDTEQDTADPVKKDSGNYKDVAKDNNKEGKADMAEEAKEVVAENPEIIAEM